MKPNWMPCCVGCLGNASIGEGIRPCWLANWPLSLTFENLAGCGCSMSVIPCATASRKPSLCCKICLGTAYCSLTRGYFSFPFFDYLTERGYWWISRYREKTQYQLLHVYYRHHEILDALVWLGSAHGSRAGYAVRLVRFGDGRQVRMYLTNVCDPHQLPLGDIARLYARRWDIELAFLTIKELFGLHHWWSSQLPLILQQLALVLLVAQLVQALRLRIAAEAGCDPFEVSLPLLIDHLPHLLRERQAPIDWVLAHGAKLGLLRPSSRLQIQAPSIPEEDLTPLPPDLPLQRRARYVTYKPRPKRPSYNKSSSKRRRRAPASSP